MSFSEPAGRAWLGAQNDGLAEFLARNAAHGGPILSMVKDGHVKDENAKDPAIPPTHSGGRRGG